MFLQWCTFKHAEKMCEIEWKRTPYNVTMGQCNDYEGRVEFKVRIFGNNLLWSCILYFWLKSWLYAFVLQGDYNNYECGLTVAAATPEDDGEWECDFESYVKVDNLLPKNSWSKFHFMGIFLTIWAMGVFTTFGINQLSCLFREAAGEADTKLPRNSKWLLSCRQRQRPRQRRQRPPQRPL